MNHDPAEAYQTKVMEKTQDFGNVKEGSRPLFTSSGSPFASGP